MFATASALALAVSLPANANPIVFNPTSAQVSDPSDQGQMQREERKQVEAQCQKGLQDYCYWLSRLMKLGIGGPADPERARTLLEGACRGHVTHACLELNPNLIDTDLRKTEELGCRDGDQRFCISLAGMLMNGVGGPADPSRAKDLLQVACRKGYASACASAEH